MADRWGPMFLGVVHVLGRLFEVIGMVASTLATLLGPAMYILFKKGGTFDKAIDIIELLWGWLQNDTAIQIAATAFGVLATALDLIVTALKWILEHIDALAKKLGDLAGPLGVVADAVGTVLSGFGIGGGGGGTVVPGQNPGLDLTLGGGGPVAPVDPNVPGVNPGGSGSVTDEVRRGGPTFHIGEVHVKAGSPKEFADALERLVPITPLEPARGPAGP
jgi:hypothetical protein